MMLLLWHEFKLSSNASQTAVNIKHGVNDSPVIGYDGASL